MNAACLRNDDVLLLLEGASTPSVDVLRRHLDDCEACQDLVAMSSSDDDIATVREGDVLLDRYRVLGSIGRGGMGVVVRAHDPKLNRDVAIKVLHSNDRSAPERMEREAHALARLSHPNIVTVFDVGTFGSRVCMAMELVDGVSLRVWLAQPRSREEILEVFDQAAQGLSAAHRANLVHRDFKPENVLVSVDGRVKVVDFGLATADVVPETRDTHASSLDESTVLHRLTRTGRIVGTPAYMAPEQFEGRTSDTRSDQFAFAVCLWEALHGARPFDGSTIGELRAGIQRGLRRTESELDRVLKRALAVDPDARYASVYELRDRLAIRPSKKRLPLVLAALTLTAVAAGFAVRAASVDAPIESRAATTATASATETKVEAAIPSPAPSPTASEVRPVERPVEKKGFSKPKPTAVAEKEPAPASKPVSRGPNGAPLIE